LADSLTPSTGVPCSYPAKMKNPLKFAGVPQSNETISATSGRSSPYCGTGGDVAA